MLKDTLKDTKGQYIKDRNSQLVLSKSHKLSSALYAVTNFMSDMDPLKWQLRQKVLEILSAAYEGNLECVLSLTDQVVSLIDIALLTQIVSEMNFSLLKREFLVFRGELLEQSAPISLSFEPAKLAMLGEKSQNSQNIVGPKVQSGARQGLILELIKQKGGVASIRDLAQAIPGLSSKTIQRELIVLVRQGLLKKEGKRRWSRYRLVV
jgi:DNA-binding transcriptional ArsR family regulator